MGEGARWVLIDPFFPSDVIRQAIRASDVKLIGGWMNGLWQAGLGTSHHEALNHQIISFVGEALEKIIANVPGVTKGNKGNGAIYKL